MKPLGFITGTGQTQFGELFDQSLTDLVWQAGSQAIQSAEITPEQLEFVIIASMTAVDLSQQGHLSALVKQLWPEITAPVFSVEAACASSSSALGVGLSYLSQAKHGLVIGVEKLTDYDTGRVANALMRAAFYQQETVQGATFPGLGGLIALAYLSQYKLDPELLGLVAVKNHYHGQFNPLAQIQRAIKLADYLASPWVAEPLRLLDCAPISDGASAVVISARPKSAQAAIIGWQQAHAPISLHQRESLTQFQALLQVWRQLQQQTGVKQSQIDVLELHDAFTVLEPMILEHLGFYPAGQALVKGYQTKQTYLTGSLPVNASGGYKACGHPVAASGLRQIIDLTRQVSGQAGKYQVDSADIGLAINFGGMAGTVVGTVVQKI